MISTRSVELVIDTVVCLTLAKWETVSGQFGGYLTAKPETDTFGHEPALVARTCSPAKLLGFLLLVLLGVATLGAVIHVLGAIRARRSQWPSVEQANNPAG